MSRNMLSTMTLWKPFNELVDEMDHLFGVNSANRKIPAMDLTEDEQNYYAELEIPGYDKDQVSLSVENGYLRIHGESAQKTTEGRKYHRRERILSSFDRMIYLPDSVDTEAIKASYEKGVLIITLPKTPQTQPKKIDISIS